MLQGRAYVILYPISKLYLDLSDSDRTSVVGCDRGEAQRWIVTQDEDDLWTFKNVAYEKYLSIADEPGPGVKLIGADSLTLWEIHGEGLGILSIRIPNSSLTVGLPGDGRVPSGTPVELRDGPIQPWRFLSSD